MEHLTREEALDLL